MARGQMSALRVTTGAGNCTRERASEREREIDRERERQRQRQSEREEREREREERKREREREKGRPWFSHTATQRATNDLSVRSNPFSVRYLMKTSVSTPSGLRWKLRPEVGSKCLLVRLLSTE